MKRDCTLIATLPSLGNMSKVENVIKSTYVSEVRFNTGAPTPYHSQGATLAVLKELADKYGKTLWVDIKGRQLRVAKWADPLYSCVELNREVEISYPARVCFRNGDTVNITHVKNGNRLFVDPLPREALGAGQSVNILASEVNVKGKYLTHRDFEYLEAAKNLGIKHVMASFIEEANDFMEIKQVMWYAKVVAKIESEKGIEFIKRYTEKYGSEHLDNLMAARDDLYIQTGQSYNMLSHLKTIIECDPDAICASRIFASLERGSKVSFADFADLELMYNLGYRRFMLCDNICNYAFDKAIAAWKEFIDG